jgi:DNA-binding transcriptional ArsR family regulator
VSSLTAKQLQAQADVFAALGDSTRLQLVQRLVNQDRLSISQLTEGSKLTRQAVTKHLQVLEQVGLVRSARIGRENLIELNLRPFKDATEYLNFVSKSWNQALNRLKIFVENT